MIANVLTVAGTDPSGGAGISADLKTFSALGVFGTSVVTAVVAQNTRGVSGIRFQEGSFVEEQMENLLEDVRIDAVKIGMLGTTEVIEAVARVLRRHRLASVVLDPVMVTTSGDRLLAEDAVQALRADLLPLCDLVTPNLPEAADLIGGTPARSEEEMTVQLRRLESLCPGVLLKGGHLEGDSSVDLLSVSGRRDRLSAQRVRTRNTHGTGCTLSSAVAALRARDQDWFTAVAQAKRYLTEALAASGQLTVGTGCGPVHHFHTLWPDDRQPSN